MLISFALEDYPIDQLDRAESSEYAAERKRTTGIEHKSVSRLFGFIVEAQRERCDAY